MFAPDFLDQRALHALPVAEPVTVPMFSLLIPFGRVEPGNPYFLSGHPYPVAVGHIGLARDRAGETLNPVSGVELLDI